MEHIAVTGSSGYLGNVIIRKLLAARPDCTIRALTYDSPLPVEDKNLVAINGDVRDINSLRILCRGCTTIYHCAAHISIVSYDKKKLYAVNVEGTRNIIKIAKENNARLVHVSSVEAIGKQHDGVHTEDDGVDPDRTLIEYGRSKALALLDVQRAVREEGLNAVIICPAGIVGPFELGTSKVGKMIRDFLSRKLPAGVKNGGFCFVDVRDVADAAIAAAETAAAGRHYILSSEFLTNKDMLEILSKQSGVPIPKLLIPTWLLKGIGMVVEPWSQVMGKDPIFSVGAARVLESNFEVASNRVEQELGVRPRPLQQALADQVAWYAKETVGLE